MSSHAAQEIVAAAASHERRCQCGGVVTSGGECAGCRARGLQRLATTGAAPRLAPPIVHEVLASGGRPLDRPVRAAMERSLGHDFANVRVHTGHRADESARAVGAVAYTVGRDVVFGRGGLDSAQTGNARLLAHELTHVVQQRNVAVALSSPLVVADADGPGEAEAERVATSLAPVPAPAMPHALVQRQTPAAATADPATDVETILSAHLDDNVREIMQILDSRFYTANDERRVIEILRHWASLQDAQQGTTRRRRNYVDEIFVKLTRTTHIGVIVDQLTSYYSLIFNRFSRVAEVREIRDTHASIFKGDSGVAEVKVSDQLKEGGWKRTAQEYWDARFKRFGQYLREVGAPVFIQNLLGGFAGVLQGVAEFEVEMAEGVMSLVQALATLGGAVMYVVSGAAEELSGGRAKGAPIVGTVLDPERWKGDWDSTISFFEGIRTALRDPKKLWETAKTAAKTEWDKVMAEYEAADEFNKSRIIARGVFKVGMAVGQVLKDLPDLAKGAVGLVKTIGKIAVKAFRLVVNAMRGIFRLAGRLLKGFWRVMEEVLENGAKRFRYFFTAASGEAVEIAENEARAFIHCTNPCKIPDEAKALEKSVEKGLALKPAKGEEIWAEVQSELGLEKPRPARPTQAWQGKWKQAKTKVYKALFGRETLPMNKPGNTQISLHHIIEKAKSQGQHATDNLIPLLEDVHQRVSARFSSILVDAAGNPILIDGETTTLRAFVATLDPAEQKAWGYKVLFDVEISLQEEGKLAGYMKTLKVVP